jgi:hypothetical protein
MRAEAENTKRTNVQHSTCKSDLAIGQRYFAETHKVSHLAERYVLIAV